MMSFSKTLIGLCFVPVCAVAEPGQDLRSQIKTDLARPAQPGTVVFSYADAVDRAQPGVVTVIAYKYVVDRPNPLYPQNDGPKRLDLGPANTAKVPDELKGNGSGIIITPTGYILTNAHVVDQADRLFVRLSHQEGDLPARFVGQDIPADVALLKIDAPNLTPLVFGDSSSVRTGDVVLALGSPYELEKTVTLGIVSATSRSMDFSRRGYEDYIQTDAPINPGNSGGALVDGLGRLIGINSARYPGEFGGNTGIGFAIPINNALRVASDLLAYGYVKRGFLGVRMAPLDQEAAMELTGQRDIYPAEIKEIEAGGPADKAGFKINDVIVGMDGRPMLSMSRWRQAIAMLEPGSKVVVQVMRGKEKVDLSVQLSEAPKPEGAAQDTKKRLALSDAAQMPLPGLKIAALDDAERHRWKIPVEITGAIVLGLDLEKGRSLGKLKTGDVITSVNGAAVKNADLLAKLLGDALPGQIMLRVWRAGQGETFAAITKPPLDAATLLPGLEVGSLDDATRQQRQIPPAVQGVIVTQALSADGKAMSKLKPGDLITSVNATKVTSVDEAVRAMKRSVAGAIMLRLWTPQGEAMAAVAKSADTP